MVATCPQSLSAAQTICIQTTCDVTSWSIRDLLKHF